MFYAPVLITSAILGSLLAGLPQGRAAAADTLWQWTDIQGQTHFSDKPPADGSLPGRQTRLESQPPVTGGGLRPGEQQALRRMELQRTRQRQHAVAVRQRSDRTVAAHRSACRATRDQLNSVRNREQRKRHSNYLRKNCW